LYAATTSGTGFTVYGAGMGFDFNNTAAKSCPYDASAYTGIKFYAKANAGNMASMTLKAMIKIRPPHRRALPVVERALPARASSAKTITT
jgi:hypothetical protein